MYCAARRDSPRRTACLWAVKILVGEKRDGSNQLGNVETVLVVGTNG